VWSLRELRSPSSPLGTLGTAGDKAEVCKGNKESIMKEGLRDARAKQKRRDRREVQVHIHADRAGAAEASPLPSKGLDKKAERARQEWMTRAAKSFWGGPPRKPIESDCPTQFTAFPTLSYCRNLFL
jgi:hypothetical protein